MKDKFATCYSEDVQKQINPGNGDANGEVNVDLRLTALKPLHASWLVDLYNHLSSDIGRRHIAKGWEKAGIAQLLDESFSLPPEDPFEEIEGSIEISWKGHVTILSILDNVSEEQEDFFITVRLTFRGIQLPLRDSILVLFQLMILTYNFCKKGKKSNLIVNFAKLNSLQTQFFSAIAKLKTREMC